jgi:hypothetical protein
MSIAEPSHTALTPVAASMPAAAWRRFVILLFVFAAALSAAVAVMVIVLDPYGLHTRIGQAPGPLMDINQRFMYPQLIRAGQFDAVVLGTSSVRLLEPRRLSQHFTGMRFANLAMNAATPWEQSEIASLMSREGPRSKVVIWGLDTTWCEADATDVSKRLTPRPFPAWLYKRASMLDAAHTFNFTTAEIAFRALAARIGLQRPRMRSDGFDEFTPPDETYDVARARYHLYHGMVPTHQILRPAQHSDNFTAAPAHLDTYPALGWLKAQLAAMPSDATKLLIMPPVHAASLARAGSADETRDMKCKMQILAIARQSGAAMLDYRFASELSIKDENFWDPLHYRRAIAEMIERDLGQVGRSSLPESHPDRLGLIALPIR